jgi:hypothetical protein
MKLLNQEESWDHIYAAMVHDISTKTPDIIILELGKKYRFDAEKNGFELHQDMEPFLLLYRNLLIGALQ